MNWQQIFKHTANIMGATLLMTLSLYTMIEKQGYRIYYPDYNPFPGSGMTGAFNGLFTSLIILIATSSMVVMYAEHRAKFGSWIVHALPVLVICWLIGYALSYFFWGLSFSDYSRLTITIPIGALVFVLPGKYIYAFILYSEKTWLARWLAPHEMDVTGFKPEQVIKAMGEPMNIINLEAKTIFVYKRFKVIFSGDQVVDVQ